jgi:glutathionylspermidine synthase
MPKGFSPFLNGYNQASYLEFFKKMVIGDQGQHTILLEIKPYEQKTRHDLLLTEAWLNVPIVCLSEIYLKGKTLYYQKNNTEFKIERIYNRVVYDELMKQAPSFLEKFKLLEQAEAIAWVNHPHHFFRISKYILPLLSHVSIPEAYLLSDLKNNQAGVNFDLANYICKPLFSFGGHGVMLEPSSNSINAINDPENWIIQKKVTYADLIETPTGPSKAEIRLFYFWDSKLNRYLATNNLTRISKGKMIGVSYNDTATWIGGSISYFEQ